ncbi:UNKNOWN [Stylonychia lemnae]|uniref:Uncharacterized protein n=1 Tax=Stylonychia lemnae TaxID=5949 RepID=A0A078AL02_STYLE|nr:UNKNOWN [Stylonychia lemnae]|eukprot:CDW83045.1 UNKNOWN [Stylonychia lemnae]
MDFKDRFKGRTGFLDKSGVNGVIAITQNPVKQSQKESSPLVGSISRKVPDILVDSRSMLQPYEDQNNSNMSEYGLKITRNNQAMQKVQSSLSLVTIKRSDIMVGSNLDHESLKFQPNSNQGLGQGSFDNKNRFTDKKYSISIQNIASRNAEIRKSNYLQKIAQNGRTQTATRNNVQLQIQNTSNTNTSKNNQETNNTYNDQQVSLNMNQMPSIQSRFKESILQKSRRYLQKVGHSMIEQDSKSIVNSNSLSPINGRENSELNKSIANPPLNNLMVRNYNGGYEKSSLNTDMIMHDQVSQNSQSHKNFHHIQNGLILTHRKYNNDNRRYSKMIEQSMPSHEQLNISIKPVELTPQLSSGKLNKINLRNRVGAGIIPDQKSEIQNVPLEQYKTPPEKIYTDPTNKQNGVSFSKSIQQIETPSFEKKEMPQKQHHQRFKQHLQRLISMKEDIDSISLKNRLLNSSNSMIINQKKEVESNASSDMNSNKLNKSEINVRHENSVGANNSLNSNSIQLPKINVNKSFHQNFIDKKQQQVLIQSIVKARINQERPKYTSNQKQLE